MDIAMDNFSPTDSFAFLDLKTGTRNQELGPTYKERRNPPLSQVL